MRRFLLLGALAAAAAVLTQAATAAPAASRTLKGTVIAKDRAHRALVVARPGGAMQTLVATKAFAKTAIGRRVVVRFTTHPGTLPTAVTVTPRGFAHTAVVHGTIVKLGKKGAVLNAGGSLLKVTLARKTSGRQLASAKSGPEVGDEVEVEVEIGDDGGLDADELVEENDDATVGGELEVRGKVTELLAPASGKDGSITVDSLGNKITCVIPAGKTLAVKLGDLVELECALVGNPGVWTVRSVDGEDGDHAAGHDGAPAGKPAAGNQGGGKDDEDEVEVRGTLGPLTADSVSVTVTPDNGKPVTCAITKGSLSSFTTGDTVKMECKSAAGVLTLKEIERTDSGEAKDEDGGGHDDNGDDEGDDDDHGDGGGDDD